MPKTTKQKSHLMARFLEAMKDSAPKVGDIVLGKVIAKEPKRIFLDLGQIGTGIVYGAEYIASREEIKKLSEGDEVSVKLLSLANEDGFFEVSLKEAGKEEAWQTLKKTKEERTILKLPVLEANRGGLILEANGITGFLPVSQLSLEHYPRVEGGEKNKILSELKKFVGRSLTVRILDANPREGKLIFSEKEAGEDSLKEILAQYKVDDIVEGTITAVVNFGAFLKFGEPPLEGLIHISEIDYRIIDDPNKFLKVGDRVQAKIIAIENNRVSLSLKALKEDPWSKVEEKYKKGAVYEGRVLKINPFGAFVELDEDIHGLAHISQFGSLAKLKAALEAGKTYKFKVLSIEPKERRLSLALESLPPAEAAESEKEAAERTKEKESIISEEKPTAESKKP